MTFSTAGFYERDEAMSHMNTQLDFIGAELAEFGLGDVELEHIWVYQDGSTSPQLIKVSELYEMPPTAS